jgi:transcriptional regulator with PAS, ATPase and Fis domain
MNYPWPGNVREMENMIEYAVHLTDNGNPIRPEQLPPKLSAQPVSAPCPRDFVSIDEYVKQSISLLQEDHSEESIAKILGISRKSLWEKRKNWNLKKSGRMN